MSWQLKLSASLGGAGLFTGALMVETDLTGLAVRGLLLALGY